MHGCISCHAVNFVIPSQLRDAAADLPERWWFAADVNDVLAKCLGRREPKKHMQARCLVPAKCCNSIQAMYDMHVPAGVTCKAHA